MMFVRYRVGCYPGSRRCRHFEYIFLPDWYWSPESAMESVLTIFLHVYVCVHTIKVGFLIVFVVAMWSDSLTDNDTDYSYENIGLTPVTGVYMRAWNVGKFTWLVQAFLSLVNTLRYRRIEKVNKLFVASFLSSLDLIPRDKQTGRMKCEYINYILMIFTNMDEKGGAFPRLYEEGTICRDCARSEAWQVQWLWFGRIAVAMLGSWVSLFTIKQEEMGKLSGPDERETDQLRWANVSQ